MGRLSRYDRARIAELHTAEMNANYDFEISVSLADIQIYGGPDNKVPDNTSISLPEFILAPMDSVSAAIRYRQGRTVILNFASFKHPGGGFLSGSMAQEEALCHESTLYNVLSQMDDFYEWNNSHTNRSLYQDRAIFTPDIVFQRDGEDYKLHVITCAAPNKSAALKAGVTEQENSEALEQRIKTVFSVAEDCDMDTLITGAFGCGVFGQDPREVATLTRNIAHHYHIQRVVCAVPPGNKNLDAFREIMEAK